MKVSNIVKNETFIFVKNPENTIVNEIKLSEELKNLPDNKVKNEMTIFVQNPENKVHNEIKFNQESKKIENILMQTINKSFKRLLYSY